MYVLRMQKEHQQNMSIQINTDNSYIVPENLRCCGNCEYLIWSIERAPYVKEELRRNSQFHCKCAKKHALEIYSLSNICKSWEQHKNIIEGPDGKPSWRDRRVNSM